MNNGPGPRTARLSELFRDLVSGASNRLGTHRAFLGAMVLVLVWLGAGPLCGFSDRWQLVMNTVTSVLTFPMVFLLQATQNRDARAIHLKLDELIRTSRARNRFAGIEMAPEEEVRRLAEEFRALRAAMLAEGKDATAPG